MRLSDALTIQRIKLNLQAQDKEAALRELAACAVIHGPIENSELYLRRVLEREVLHSTSLGRGIAVPHAQADGVEGVFCCLGVSPEGIEYDAIDDQPARIICLIAAQEGLDGLYLQLLSHISRLFARGDIREQILAAESPEEVLDYIRTAERSLAERRR
jgi:mannitol/fructose-specific phosphotransferase system IIA component (Ntr-type)